MFKQEKKKQNLTVKRFAIFLIISAFVITAIAPIASALL